MMSDEQRTKAAETMKGPPSKNVLPAAESPTAENLSDPVDKKALFIMQLKIEQHMNQQITDLKEVLLANVEIKFKQIIKEPTDRVYIQIKDQNGLIQRLLESIQNKYNDAAAARVTNAGGEKPKIPIDVPEGNPPVGDIKDWELKTAKSGLEYFTTENAAILEQVFHSFGRENVEAGKAEGFKVFENSPQRLNWFRPKGKSHKWKSASNEKTDENQKQL